MVFVVARNYELYGEKFHLKVVGNSLQIMCIVYKDVNNYFSKNLLDENI